MATGGALIGALRVTLGLDSAQFEAGTKRARNVAKRDVGEIQKIANGAKLALAGMFSVATIGAFTAAAKRALDFAGGLGELAQQAGISTKALQEYQAIGVGVGLTNGDIVSSFARLSKSIGEAQDGDKRLADVFRQLGIEVKGLTAEDAMPKLIAAFERIKSPTDQARLAADLFGRTAGAKLLPVLNLTSEGFEKARQEAHEFGMVLSDEAIASADAASDSLARLTKVVEINFAAAMSGGADGVAAMADELARMVSRLPGQIDAIRKFAFAAAEALRIAGPLGDFVANKAKRAATYTLSDKEFAKAQRDTAARIKANPNDGEAVEFGKFLLQQAQDRQRSRSAPSASTAGGDAPRTDRSSGSGGKSKKAPRDRTADYLERYNLEIASLQDEYLGLQQRITTDVRERARLEHDRIENERQAYEFDIQNRVKSGELTEAQAETLRIQNKKNAAKQNTLVNWQLDDELTEQELDLKRSQIDLDNEILGIQLDGARTQEERRRIQLRILDNEIELERAALEAVKAKHDSTEVEHQIAQAKIDQLDREKAGRAAAIRRDTMGPIDSYFDSLPKSVDEFNESMQRAAVEGLGDLKSGLSDVLLRGENVFDALGNAVDRFVAKLLDMALDQALASIFSSAGGLFGGGGGTFIPASGPGAIVGTTTFSKIPGAATGGSFMVGGKSGTDRNMLAINGVPRVRVSNDERVDIVPRGQQRQPPIIIQQVFEESANLLPTVRTISSGVTTQQIGGVARQQARSGRMLLA